MSALLKKIRQYILQEQPIQKTYAGWANKKYQPAPAVSFVIQSHNRSDQVRILVSKLRAIADSEIIVIDDGSALSHTTQLTRLLQGANEFLLRCNDLYEVITYDRALNFAKGQYIVLLQDDDDFDSLVWVTEGIQHFESDAQLAILGGRDGATLLPFSVDGTGIRGSFTLEKEMAYRANSYRIALTKNADSATGMTYVQYVDRAPMWFRRNLFQQVLKGIDVSFAPFQWDDAEICLRAWLNGLRVGHYSARFRIGGLGLGGMQIWNNELHHRQDEVNVKKLYDLYAPHLEQIDILVKASNQQCTTETAQ